MVSSKAWQLIIVAATGTALAAAPLLIYRWKRSIQNAKRQEALRLLHKVELIVSEVAVRLMHLESQVDDFVANQGREDNEEESASTLNSYYHFDSNGNKLKTKWDAYDVDAELERLDRTDGGEENAPQTSAPARRSAPTLSKPKLLSTAAGIEHEFEAVLEFLDDIRGDGQVRQLRKSIATKITKEQFGRIDSIRSTLNSAE